MLKNKNVNIHSNTEKTKAGSRHYIHAEDVSNGHVNNRKKIR